MMRQVPVGGIVSVIRRAVEADVAACEAILRGLPSWFGIEAAIIRYVAAIRSMETYLIESHGNVAGFISLEPTSAAATEIHVMAIAEGYHRFGFGRALVDHCEALLRARGMQYFHVKTLGPSRVWEPYARTRAFYLAMGFQPLEENALWGDVNPCLMLVKHLGCGPAATV